MGTRLTAYTSPFSDGCTRPNPESIILPDFIFLDFLNFLRGINITIFFYRWS